MDAQRCAHHRDEARRAQDCAARKFQVNEVKYFNVEYGCSWFNKHCYACYRIIYCPYRIIDCFQVYPYR